LREWPPEGPKLLWTAENLGFGYSTVSIAHSTVYTGGNIDKKMVITALDLDGNVRWKFDEYDGYEKHMAGSRATPTIDGDRLYHKSPIGDVFCLKAKTGKKIWGLNILEKFGSENIRWALSESLLIDGDRVICSPCGPNTAVVALNKMTGETVWKSASADGDLASYASPILVEYQGLRIILTMTAKALIGVHADTGKLLFRFPHETEHEANVASPVYHDGQVFISSGYGTTGSVMVKLEVNDDNVTATKVWGSRELDNHHGGVILVDGNLYGSSHRFNHGKWICLDWKTGAMKYAEKGVGKGSLTYADGMLYTLSSRRVMGLVKATPDAHVLSGRFGLPKLANTTSRSHPVVCGGRLYIRHNAYLFVYDIRARTDRAVSAKGGARMKDRFKPLYGLFGRSSQTKVEVVSGPEPVKMRNGGVAGKRWIATCAEHRFSAEKGWAATEEKYRFKLTIQDATGVELDRLIAKLERLPGPYMRACVAVSDDGEDGIAVYAELGGARAHGGQGYINIIPVADALVIAHEAGHTLEQVYRSKHKGVLDDWGKAIEADGTSVSAYGDKVRHEDLAEFAQVYAVCMDQGEEPLAALRELSPARFALWEKILVGPGEE